MDENLTRLQELFHLQDVDARLYSPLTLAYIGDAVYEMIVRTVLVMEKDRSVNAFHRRASGIVRASAQSKMIEALLPDLTEEEQQIFRRGRNAHPGSVAKHATVGEYHRATGFEALIGYLYLTHRWTRILELVKMGMKTV